MDLLNRADDDCKKVLIFRHEHGKTIVHGGI